MSKISHKKLIVKLTPVSTNEPMLKYDLKGNKGLYFDINKKKNKPEIKTEEQNKNKMKKKKKIKKSKANYSSYFNKPF